MKGLSPLDPLLADQVDPALTRRAWEFGRLVLDPACRSGPELVRRSIFLGVQHLAATTDAQHVFACCTPILARLYRRYGFSVLTTTVSTRAAAGSYCLIHGAVGEVLRASAGCPEAVLN